MMTVSAHERRRGFLVRTETKIVLWSDFKRAAAVNTSWPLHKLSALG